jgi:hypothetical protein
VNDCFECAKAIDSTAAAAEDAEVKGVTLFTFI